MRRLVVEFTPGKKQLIELDDSSRVNRPEAVVWDEREAGPIPEALLAQCAPSVAPVTKGRATLVAGVAQVPLAGIKASAEIDLRVVSAHGTRGFLNYHVTEGQGFDITSESATEGSTVAWEIL